MKAMGVKKILLVVLIALLALPFGAIAAELKLGILPRLTEKEMRDGFTPLAAHLSKELGVRVVLVIPKDFDTWRKQAEARAFDFVYTNPYLYVLLKKAVPETEVIAISSEPEIGDNIKGTIIVRKDSPIRSIADLRGKTIAATDPGSAGAYLVQMKMLSRAGVKKEDVKILFERRRDPVADAVLAGRADAGFVRDDDVERLRAGADKFRRIAVSDPIPNWPIAISKKMDPAMAKKLKDALLKLRTGSLTAISILGPARISGFVPVTDKEYDIMREAAKAIRAW